MIYADNAATTKISETALEKWCSVVRNNGGNASSLHGLGTHAKRELMFAREVIADSIGAEPDEIFFTSGGTEGDNWAIKGTIGSFSEPVHIAVSEIEHHAVLRSASALERKGINCDLIPVDTFGKVLPDSLESMITPSTSLVSVMLANNEIGTVQPIADLANIAHSHNAVFHTDAVQAVGHIPVDVRELNVDLLSASSHKFNGPKGVGFLYVRRGTQITPLLDGGQQESSLRAGTENVAGIAAMAVALSEHIKSLTDEQAHVMRVADRFCDEIRKEIPNAHFNGDPESRLPGIISLSLLGVSGESLLHILDLRGIAVSTGAACDSQRTQISHVLHAIGLSDELAKGTLRVSFGGENTEDEAVTISTEIKKAFEKVKQF